MGYELFHKECEKEREKGSKKFMGWMPFSALALRPLGASRGPSAECLACGLPGSKMDGEIVIAETLAHFASSTQIAGRAPMNSTRLFGEWKSPSPVTTDFRPVRGNGPLDFFYKAL